MIADDMTWKEIKRKVGEMATMENDLRQAQGSRDYWKAKFESLEQDVGERYVTLPVDANGATIKPGAMVLHGGRTWRVKTLMLTDEREWQLDCHAEYGWDDSTAKPEECTVLEDYVVVEPRTLEDVLLDMAVNWECAADGEDKAEVLKEYAAKLRLADGWEVQQ